MIRIIAYQFAENISLKKFKTDYKGELLSSSSFELFYKFKEGYIYILNYGSVVFANIDEIDRSTFIKYIKEYSENQLEKEHLEDFIIYQDNIKTPVFSYNSLVVSEITPELIKIAMLQVAQSAALDFYLERSEALFDETGVLTTQLEKHGSLLISRKKLLQFIGKAINTKNRIVDNLYVIDSPLLVWENELLEQVNNGLAKTFDIAIRFKELEYLLKIVESNLAIFIQLEDTRKSHFLEWIIIVLILFEVVHLVVNKLFF
jgi:required for meiotic nuclear division protein 1